MTDTATPAPTLTGWPIAMIDLGERAGRNLDGLEPLMASITGEGLLFPVTIGPTRRLILGARRLEACRQLGWRTIPTVQVTMISEALDRLAVENADPDHPPTLLTVAEAMGLDVAWRELEWWPKLPPSPCGTRREAVNGERHRRVLAVAHGLNTGQYYMARILAHAARGYIETYGRRTSVPPGARERAIEALATIRDPKSIVPAYNRYMAGLPASTGTARKQIPRTQARSVTSALGALSGITTGLANVTGIDPTTPRSVTAQWEQDAMAAKRALNAFLRIVKEHHK
jgi:ParB-like nuclease domain